jgi:polyisoprenoid-binding protein YceI
MKHTRSVRRAAAGAVLLAAATTARAGDDLPRGSYVLDPSHASLLLSVDHLGFSRYTMQFTRFTASFSGDPDELSGVSLAASADLRSLQLPAPPAGFLDTLLGPDWLDAGRYPRATFVSTSVEPLGPRTARVRGDLTLHGVTRPVALEATFNGGYPGLPGLDPAARVGFSASGVLKRSDFGISAGIPQPGSSLGVSDEVRFSVEAEFTGPRLAR